MQLLTTTFLLTIILVALESRSGSIPLFQNRYQKFSVSADTDIDPMPAQFFLNQGRISIVSVCVPNLLITLSCFTHNLLNIQLYCKEKQQMNGYVIIINDKNTFIN